MEKTLCRFCVDSFASSRIRLCCVQHDETFDSRQRVLRRKMANWAKRSAMSNKEKKEWVMKQQKPFPSPAERLEYYLGPSFAGKYQG
jgi:hypothetical protein